jgi:hypothetical protein
MEGIHSHAHSHGGCGHSHTEIAPVSSPVRPDEDEDTLDRRILAGLLPAEPPAALAPAASLREEFLRAERLYHHVVDDVGECEGEHSVERHITDALGAFTRCSALVRSEGVFSPNETMDDISTGALQYLLIEFYIAALRQRRMTNRLVVIDAWLKGVHNNESSFHDAGSPS